MITRPNPEFDAAKWAEIEERAATIARGKKYREALRLTDGLAFGALMRHLSLSGDDFAECRRLTDAFNPGAHEVMAWIEIGRPRFAQRYIWVRQ
jgi:hypothetical protein